MRTEPLVEVGWLWPAYMQNRHVYDLIRKLEAEAPGGRRRVLEQWLGETYTPGYLAEMFVSRYSVVPGVREYSAAIREAIECAQLGLFRAAVSTLLPVLEGIIRSVAGNDGGVDTKSREFIGAIDKMIAREQEHDIGDASAERIAMLRAFKAFFEQHLYIPKDNFTGQMELNRHGILHGFFKDFGTESNFLILISLLDQLTFVATLRTSGVSALAPDSMPESRALARYFLALRMLRAQRPRG